MGNGFEGAQSGVDFGSRLLSNVFALHRRDQDIEREDANRQRESMMSILTAAANSGNVNPSDMPQLLKQLFEISSVKPNKQAIEAIGQHASDLFTQNTVTRPAPKRWRTTAIDEVPITNTAEIAPSPPLPDVPGVSGPAVRWMSPDERATIARRAKVKEAEAMLPIQQKMVETKEFQRRLTQAEKLTADEDRALAVVNARTAGAAQKRVTELAYAYESGGYSAEDAQQKASKDVLREFNAKVGLTTARTAESQARIDIAKGRLADAQARTNLMKTRTDAYVNRMTQLVAGGAKEKSLVPVYNAMIRDLLPERTALQRMIIKLESDPNVDSEDEEVQTDITNFKSRIAEIDARIAEAKTQFLPNSRVATPNVFAGAAVNGDVTPVSPMRGGKIVAARPSFNLRAWKADHPNATEQEISAKRNQYAGKYNIIE